MGFLKKLFCGVILVFGLTCSVFAASGSENLCLYARAKAPIVSMPKIINFTKQIVDDPHFDAEIAIFASAFRHPTYEGLSKKENIGVFFFYKAGEPLEYVIVAKFKKNSPLKNDLIASGLRIKDIARWSFIARNADILDRLATQELVQITEKDLKSDFEVCPLLNRLSENLNVDTVNQILQLKDEKSIKQLRFVLHTIRDEIDELRKLTISAYLDDDETRLDVRIDAKPGSEIGEWFSADAGGTINIPQCTFKTAPLTSTFSRIDINSYRTFATRLWHKLLKNSDLTKVDIKIQRTIDDLDEFAKKANGQSAHYSFAGKDDEKDTLLLIFNGLFDDAYVKRVCCEVLPNIDSKWKCTLNTPLRYSDCNIFQANHSDKPTLYVCACKNNLVICNDEDTTKAAVDNIFNNRSKISLSKGCAAVSMIDFRAMFNACASSLLPPNFSDLTMKPFKYQVNFAKNRYVSSLKLDNASLKNVFKMLLYVGARDQDSSKEEN